MQLRRDPSPGLDSSPKAAPACPVVTAASQAQPPIALDPDPMQGSLLEAFPGLDRGAKVFSIYYAKNPTFGYPTVETNPDLERDFALLGAMRAEDQTEVFWKMQGENWSPQGQARELLAGLQLRHTSMSVGDLAFDHETKKLMVVDRFGWTEATPRQPLL